MPARDFSAGRCRLQRDHAAGRTGAARFQNGVDAKKGSDVQHHIPGCNFLLDEPVESLFGCVRHEMAPPRIDPDRVVVDSPGHARAPVSRAQHQ
jgi:hypothetical protein